MRRRGVSARKAEIVRQSRCKGRPIELPTGTVTAMAYDNLADFLEVLEDCGELVRVEAQVDPDKEIAAITERVAKSGGPALFFQNVRGHDQAVLTNLLGSERRLCRALAVDSLEELSTRAAEILKPPAESSWLSRLRDTSSTGAWGGIPPKMVSSGPAQQVVKLGRDVDLTTLPFLKCWPEDALQTITAGQVFTRDPETHDRNVGLYGLAVAQPRRLAILWDAHHGARRHYEEFRAAGEKMPLAVALGGDPLFVYMAAAPLPAGADECHLGGFLRGRPAELIKCRTIEMEVPSTSEMIIEGYVDPAEAEVDVGPLGGMTGFYGPARSAPVLYVTAVTHRTTPIVPSIIAGEPPHEWCWFARVTRALLLPFARRLIPELIDFELPDFGAARRCLFVAIEKSYPHQAQKAAAALLGAGPFIGAKLAVVVDADVNLRADQEVWSRVAANVVPSRDLAMLPAPTDRFDHAVPEVSAGQVMIIDATRKLPGEHPRRWPKATRASDETREQIERRWEEYGLK